MLAKRWQSDVGATSPCDVGPKSAIRRWPNIACRRNGNGRNTNVGPTLAMRYVGATSPCDVGPTSPCRLCPNIACRHNANRRNTDVGPTLAMRRRHVILGQRREGDVGPASQTNIMPTVGMPTLSQRCNYDRDGTDFCRPCANVAMLPGLADPYSFWWRYSCHMHGHINTHTGKWPYQMKDGRTPAPAWLSGRIR
jgi:hypothetical protein